MYLKETVRVARMVYGDPLVQHQLFLYFLTVLTLWQAVLRAM